MGVIVRCNWSVNLCEFTKNFIKTPRQSQCQKGSKIDTEEHNTALRKYVVLVFGLFVFLSDTVPSVSKI